VENPCPLIGQDGCKLIYSGADVLGLLDSQTYKKYLR
jgi:hypothetical protein